MILKKHLKTWEGKGKKGGIKHEANNLTIKSKKKKGGESNGLKKKSICLALKVQLTTYSLLCKQP